MSAGRRLNTTIGPTSADRLPRKADGRTPKLPKRCVVERALKRLVDDLDRGQLQRGLAGDDRDCGQDRQATEAKGLVVQASGTRRSTMLERTMTTRRRSGARSGRMQAGPGLRWMS